MFSLLNFIYDLGPVRIGDIIKVHDQQSDISRFDRIVK